MFFSEIFRGILRRLLGITGTPLGLYSDTCGASLERLKERHPEGGSNLLLALYLDSASVLIYCSAQAPSFPLMSNILPSP